MTAKVTIELPEELIVHIRAIAARTHRPIEQVSAQWIDALENSAAVDSLADPEVLALADFQFDEPTQDALGDLLDQQRESELDETGRRHLDELMTVVRHTQVWKSHALKIAVERGLRPRLG